MKRLATFSAILVLFVSAFLISCGGVISGSSSISSKEFDVSGFTKIEAHNGFQLDISKGDTFSVEITANDNVYKYLEVEVSGGKLLLKLEPGRIYSNLNLEARITTPNIIELDLSGGSYGAIDGFVSSHDFLANLSGGSIISGNMIAANFEFDLSGGSQINLSGSANNLEANSSGGSQINLEGFPVINAVIDISGGGRATINLSGTLVANLSGGSQLYYVGNPTLRDINLSGGSQISEK